MPSIHHSDETDTLAGVSRVVLRALDALAPVDGADGHRRRPLETYLDQMQEACLAPTPAVLLGLLCTMRRARISSLQIAEIYIPEVARRLGDGWLADEIDFAQVTIGSARLQGLLRRLEPDWGLPRGARFESPPAYLVGVPAGAQHTLGATILAGQLRHRGLSVHVDLQMTGDSIAAQVRNEHYCGVMISVASLEHLEVCRHLIEKSRQESRDTPVILGGIVLEQHDITESSTGADLVTSDMHEALRYCDIAVAHFADELAAAGADPRADAGKRRAAE